MNVPHVPREPLVDKNGQVTNAWRNYFTQSSQEQQKSLSNEGYYVPQHDPTSIAKLNTTQSVSGLLYDHLNKFMKVNTTGVYKNLGTYEELKTDEINKIPKSELNGRLIWDTVANKLHVGADNELKTLVLE